MMIHERDDMKETPRFFAFEEDFIESGIRCIPMCVRFKLDACGIKLKLAEWNSMTAEERWALAEKNCATPDETRRYRAELIDLIFLRTGNAAAFIEVETDPAWGRLDEVPPRVAAQLAERSFASSLDRWRRLTDLQRFALVKLSSPGHENKNFSRAAEAFGFRRKT